jgi:glutathione S-transferase
MRKLRLVIGDKNYSSWSLVPWLMLKMYDIDFDEIFIKLYQDNTAEKLGPYSPSLRVPVLLHKDINVWDSLSICEHINEEIIGGVGWPMSAKRRASARSVAAEIHSEFRQLKEQWPMNCKASYPLSSSEEVKNEIARIDAIWSCCRRSYGENGNYLFGRFSIADCMSVPMAIRFDSYSADLSEEARIYMQTLLDNPFVQKWITDGRREVEPLTIAYSNTA